MFNRKIEAASGSRSEQTLRNALFVPFFQEPGSILPIVDSHSLELAATFREEERLAALIAEPQPTEEPLALKTVSKDTIYQVIAMARRVARAGFPTALVSLDEMLDTAEVFQSRIPSVAVVNQLLLHRDLVNEYPHSTPSDILFVIEATRRHGPGHSEAAEALVDLLSSLDENDNPVWTARVAAALAYFSVQPTP